MAVRTSKSLSVALLLVVSVVICATQAVAQVPDEWTCSSAWWDDGLCDCGCGVFDEDDCADETTASCYSGPHSCPAGQAPSPDQNWLCRDVVCGDGVRDRPDEACDDGNTDDDDGCSAACEIEAGWACPTEGAPCLEIPAVWTQEADDFGA